MSLPWAGCISSPLREEGSFSRGICPMNLHHQNKTKGRGRCHLLLLARLFWSSTPFITLLKLHPHFPISFSASGFLQHDRFIPMNFCCLKPGLCCPSPTPWRGQGFPGGSWALLKSMHQVIQLRWSVFWRCFLPSEKQLSTWAPAWQSQSQRPPGLGEGLRVFSQGQTPPLTCSSSCAALKGFA